MLIILLMLQMVSFLIYHRSYSIKKGEKRGGAMRREGERGNFALNTELNKHIDNSRMTTVITCDFRVLQTLKSFA